jgi:hypothetical protein
MDNKIEKWSLATLNVYSRILSVQELEQLVPFPPDRSRQKGTQRGRQPGNVYPHSVLAFESHIDQSAKPQAHLEDLLSRLSPASDALRAFVQRARSDDFQPPAKGREWVPVRVSLVEESSDGHMGVEIDPDQLRAIADMGAVLGVELETGDYDDGDLSDDAGAES